MVVVTSAAHKDVLKTLLKNKSGLLRGGVLRIVLKFI